MKVLVIFRISAKIPLLELSIFIDFKAFKSDDNNKFKGTSKPPYIIKNRIKFPMELYFNPKPFRTIYSKKVKKRATIATIAIHKIIVFVFLILILSLYFFCNNFIPCVLYLIVKYFL